MTTLRTKTVIQKWLTWINHFNPYQATYTSVRFRAYEVAHFNPYQATYTSVRFRAYEVARARLTSADGSPLPFSTKVGFYPFQTLILINPPHVTFPFLRKMGGWNHFWEKGNIKKWDFN